MKTRFLSCLFLFTLFNLISCENATKQNIGFPQNKVSDTIIFAEEFKQIQSQLENQDTKKAARLNAELFKKAHFSGNKFFMGKSYFVKGYLDLLKNKDDSAYYFFNQAKENFLEINDSLGTAKALANMAIIQSNKSDFYGCELAAAEALNYAKNQKVENRLYLSVYNCLAISSKNTGNDEEAVYWYNKAFSVIEEPMHKIITKNNLAMAYNNSRQFAKAENILLKLHRDALVKSNPKMNAKIADNLAYVQWLNHSPGNHLSAMLNALKTRKEIKDDWGQIASNSHLSEYFEKINPGKSLFYAKQMLRKANELNSPEDKLDALKKLIRLENGEILKDLSTQYTKLNDSILQIRNATQDHFAKIRYDSEQNRKENQLLRAETAQQELELEKRKVWTVVFAALVILISIAVLAFFRIQKIRHQKLITEEIYAAETKIAGKIHDDLANNIYRIMSDMENASEQILPQKKNELLNQLDSVYKLARDISRENAPIETGENYEEELLSLISSYKNENTNLVLMGFSDVNWKMLRSEKQIQLYKVLQELLTNMKKHSRATLVVLSFQSEKNNLQIFYTDNGIGTTENQLNTKNGIRITENRIEKLKGSISFVCEPNKGLKVNIKIPL